VVALHLGCKSTTNQRLLAGFKSGSNVNLVLRYFQKVNGVVTLEASQGLAQNSCNSLFMKKTDCSSEDDGKSASGHWNQLLKTTENGVDARIP
jgi:hypothetical protein